MSTLFVGQNKIALDTTESTNNFAANLIKETNVLDGTVIMAENQTNGKGQAKNTWISEPGENLTCSYVFRPNFLAIQDRFFLSMVVSVALIEVLRSYKISAIIKWPNDILVENRKIAGILIENNIQGNKFTASIVGIGLNVNQEFFDNSLEATSIRNVTGKQYNLENVLELLNSALERHYLKLKADHTADIKEEYMSALLGFRSELMYQELSSGSVFKGKIIDVKNCGELVLKSEDEVRSFLFKTIRLI